jgi:hypothetical protein
MASSPITISPTAHRFFNQLATAQAATAAYTLGHVTQAGGKLAPFTASTPISQVCNTRPEELEFDASEVLGPFSKQTWPSVIHLKFHSRPDPAPANPNPTAVQTLMASFYEHAFITYYEKNVEDIKAKHGAKKNWPIVLNFGRIVRNAFAHGGTINITDGISASWSGITYSDTDNGRRVLYNDLTSGDLTLLMVDMDSLI